MPLISLALIKILMHKYYYFAVIRFEEVMKAGATRPNRVPVTHFGKNAYSTPEECVNANLAWMCKHIGERFSVCGFDKRLDLDERGVCRGYINESVDQPA